MPNAHGRAVDTTHLSWEATAERLIFHRDTQAHFLRWSHVLKYLQKHRGALHILELGCGKEMPLARMLYSNRSLPASYTGVDYRRMVVPDMLTKVVADGKFNLTLLDQTDAATVNDPEGGRWDVLVSFECIEHVEPGHTRTILSNALNLLQPDGVFFLSTPCFDPAVGAADNHVSEPTYEALGALIEDLGWVIEGHWGTFASIKDYEPHITKRYGEDVHNAFRLLREYYDTNILANVFAPLFPDKSRNCLWQLRHPDNSRWFGKAPPARQFPPLETVDGPWTSSEKWQDLNDFAFDAPEPGDTP